MSQETIKPAVPLPRPDRPPLDAYILGNPDPLAKRPHPMMGLHSIHIVAGDSGCGKTTWLFQMVHAMQNGKDFFGFPTKNQPAVYASLDRNTLESEYTAERLGLEAQYGDFIPMYQFPVKLSDPSHFHDYRAEEVILGVLNLHPKTKVIILDGIMFVAMKGKINEYQTMAYWWGRLAKFCIDKGVCLIGVCHTPKQRKGQEITNPRSMAIGTVSTPGCIGTLIVFETVHEKLWKLHFLGRDLPPTKYMVQRGDNGEVIEVPKDADDRKAKIMAYMNQFALGAKIPFADIETALANISVSRQSLYKYVNALLDSGDLLRVGHGLYARAARGGEPATAFNKALEAETEGPPFEPGSFAAVTATVTPSTEACPPPAPQDPPASRILLN